MNKLSLLVSVVAIVGAIFFMVNSVQAGSCRDKKMTQEINRATQECNACCYKTRLTGRVQVDYHTGYISCDCEESHGSARKCQNIKVPAVLDRGQKKACEKCCREFGQRHTRDSNSMCKCYD